LPALAQTYAYRAQHRVQAKRKRPVGGGLPVYPVRLLPRGLALALAGLSVLHLCFSSQVAALARTKTDSVHLCRCASRFDASGYRISSPD